MTRAALVILALAALVVLLSLRSGEPPADFTFYNGNDVTTLDPQRVSWLPDMRVARLVFEPLVQNDMLSPDAAIVPAAAERWEVSPDRLRYTFHLRGDARWSNGSPVTAHHFVYAWRRGMLPDLASDYAAMFRFVRGADEFAEWRTEQLALMERGQSPFPDGDTLWAATLERFDRTVGLRAEGDRTLVVELRERVPFFLDLCAFDPFSPVYPPLVDQFERPDPKTGRLLRRPGWTRPPHLISNGPFTVSAWRFKRGMRLEQNPHYWNRAALNIRSISIPSIGDPTAAVLAFRTGAVDMLAEVYAPYRGEIVEAKLSFRAEHEPEARALADLGLDQFEIDRRLPPDPRRDAHIVPAFGTYFWNFNCSPTLPDGRPNPFADARVRRAFALVVDKRSIADQVRRLGERTAGALVPPGSIAGYTPPTGLPNIGDATTEQERDNIVDTARALLAEAGYPNPASDFPITVELLFNKDSGHDLIAQVLASNWRRHLGVPVSLRQTELKIYREQLKEHRFITSRGSWFGDFADPTTFLDINRTGDGNNDRNFSSPRFDALLDRARAEPDPQRRLDILAEAERVIVEEELPVLPILHYVSLYMFDPARVTGVSSHPRTKQTLHLVDILGDGLGDDAPITMKSERSETP
jgi:oligopeptide transport system substrate-binding protein